MKTPKFRSYFTPDEIETILINIYYSQLHEGSQQYNVQTCFVTRRIDEARGKRVTVCKNCRCGI